MPVPVVSGLPSTITLPTTGTRLLLESPHPATRAIPTPTQTTRKPGPWSSVWKRDKAHPPFCVPVNPEEVGECPFDSVPLSVTTAARDARTVATDFGPFTSQACRFARPTRDDLVGGPFAPYPDECGYLNALRGSAPKTISHQGFFMLASYRFPIRIWLVITSNLFVVFLSAGSVGRLHQALAGEPAANNSPRLAVLLIFDQMRADYILRWEKLFGERGFRRLQQEGAWFRNCYYPYSDTITGAGHASIATGCSPAEHGIIENDWYDRTTGKDVNCVVAGRYERVPTIPHAEPPSVAEQKRIAKTSVSPERLLAPTLGDALKQGTGGKGRVVALSLKDRSAVLPAGRRADACYWFDTHDGIFVTSTYYRLQVHPWVAAFNATQPADHWFGKAWTRFRPDLEYEFYSGPDDVRAEGRGFGQERTFPHPMMGGKPKISDDYYQAVID